MRPPGHDDIGERRGLALKGPDQSRDRRNKLVLDDLHGSDVHHRRERVVGRLAVVDVIIRVDRFFAAQHPAGELDGTVGDHLIGVHVALRARAGLEHHQRKFRIPSPSNNLIGGAHDQLHLVDGQLAQRFIRQRAGFLQNSEAADNIAPPDVILDPDREILPAPLGLRAPQMGGRHSDVTECIVFDPGIGVFHRHRGNPC